MPWQLVWCKGSGRKPTPNTRVENKAQCRRCKRIVLLKKNGLTRAHRGDFRDLTWIDKPLT